MAQVTVESPRVQWRRWLPLGMSRRRADDGGLRSRIAIDRLLPSNVYDRTRLILLVFSFLTALALVVASVRGALIDSRLKVLPGVLLVVLAMRWVGEYRNRPAGLWWDWLEGVGIFAIGVVTRPIDIVLLIFVRLCMRSLEARGVRLAYLICLYGIAFAGSVFVATQLSAGTPIEELVFLGSAFPLGAITMSGLGTVLSKDSELTSRLETEEALRISEANFRVLFTANPQPMWVLDAKTQRFIEVNTAATHHYGYTRDEFLTMRSSDIRPPGELDGLQTEQFGDGLARSKALRHSLKDGRIIVVDITAHNLEFNGHPSILVLAQDVTEQMQLDERLRHQAFHDTLTGLANRALFYDRVGLAAARVARSEDGFAVLFIDLDNFKAINDSVGHNAGDTVLVEVANRISGSIRPSDTAARLGGDEFAVLIDPVQTSANAVGIAERIAASLNVPVEAEGDTWFVSGSIGIAFSGDAGETVDAILRSADVAMYSAKRRGRAQFSIFEPEMHESVVERSMLEAELRQGIARDELTLFYQPQIDLKHNVVTGVEALVRWNHPRRGLLGPGEFIPIAEESGLVAEVDDWVLRAAAMQMRKWQVAGTDGLTVGVNVSGKEFAQAGLAERIKTTVAETGLPPLCVELEVTESVAFETEGARSTLASLRQLGFRVAIDDFGVGFSMLGRLQDLPVDRLKIDRSFVEKITKGEDEAPIVTGMIAMAHSLKLEVVAEGIETSEQLAFLQRNGCDVGQGYGLGKPMRAEEIEKLMHSSPAPAYAGGQAGA
jgi:diguanylate cyclase (GGDEF)-like protein/PAS domain S-box-containing protein